MPRPQENIMLSPPWDVSRRNSIASIANRRRSSLSLSMFDFALFPVRQEDPDPYAPLSINEGVPLCKHLAYHNVRSPASERMLTDKSESSGISIPSLSASSYSSNQSSLSFDNQGSPRAPRSSAVPPPVLSGSAVPAAPPVSSATMPNLPMNEDEDMDGQRFKPFHEEKWSLRYKELLEFHQQHGHSAVPHTYPKNPQLARWVKRQRRQYKLRKDGRPSTMTSVRLELLDNVGFVWDSHDVNWREKLESLEEFRKEHGHCNVPSNYKNKKLATWVKCQRRQYKLYWDGKPSAMSPQRILELEKVGFEWEIRSAAPRVGPRAVTAVSEDYNLLYQSINDL